MNGKVRMRLHEIMEKALPGDMASKVFDIFIVTLISLNVVMVILETVRALADQYGDFFQIFEGFSVLVFTVEYLLRLWSCTAEPKTDHPVWGRLRFMLMPLALIDFLAIFPYYLQLLVVLPAGFVHPLRLFRLFRLFKIGRYSRSMRLLGRVLGEKKRELYVVVFVLTILLVMVSSLMYFVEHKAQPEAFSSIPAAMWWGMVTLTTVGYGDVYPITALGKFFGVLIAVLGVGMFALPAGILSSGFVGFLQEDRDESLICPHCGKDVHAAVEEE